MAKMPKEYIFWRNNQLVVIRPTGLKLIKGHPAIGLKIILPLPTSINVRRKR